MVRRQISLPCNVPAIERLERYRLRVKSPVAGDEFVERLVHFEAVNSVNGEHLVED